MPIQLKLRDDLEEAVAADPDGNPLRLNFYPQGKAHYRDLEPGKAAELALSGEQLTI